MKFESINEVCIKWRKEIDNAILGEIKEKAIEHGIKTEYILNEKAIISALEKQIPKKPKDHPLSDGKCPCCNAVFDYDWKPKSKFCQNCGQALDWGDTE